MTTPVPEPLADLAPRDLKRTVRLIAAFKSRDEFETGLVVQELRDDPRGTDAAIIILAGVTTLLVALLKEAESAAESASEHRS